ncbi:PREDICTED: uncharacterized protein LOC101296316 [Fragaria vesca subsp. vesca]
MSHIPDVGLISQQSEDDLESSQTSEIPPGPETPLPHLSKLSSIKPSPFLVVHLVDIIYNNCFSLRLYNGDYQSDATGSAMVVLSVSSILGHGGQPEIVLEALSYCLEQIFSPSFKQMGGLQFGLGLEDDVIPYIVVLALRSVEDGPGWGDRAEVRKTTKIKKS